MPQDVPTLAKEKGQMGSSTLADWSFGRMAPSAFVALAFRRKGR
jgi:hypothetical protein